jgi:hypothetical protein
MAVGCYEALKERGEHVGNTIGVMGYDDQEIAQHLNPPLSTVLLPHREMAVVRGASGEIARRVSPCVKLKLALSRLIPFSKMAIDKAGADWVGGDMRRARAAARVVLFNERWTR